MSQPDGSTFAHPYAPYSVFPPPSDTRDQPLTLKQDPDGRSNGTHEAHRMQLPFPPPPQQRDALPPLQHLPALPQAFNMQSPGHPSLGLSSLQQPGYTPLQGFQQPSPPATSMFNVPRTTTFSRHRNGPMPASLPILSRLEGASLSSPGSAAFSPQFSPSHAHSPSASSSLSNPTTAGLSASLTGSLKGKRKRANPQQLSLLNQIFEMTFFPSTELRNAIGKELGMMPRTVQIWFQNRRQAWRAHKHRVSDPSQVAEGGHGSVDGSVPTTPVTIAPTAQANETNELQSNDNERGGWQVLRAFQSRKAAGELHEYEYGTVSAGGVADSGAAVVGSQSGGEGSHGGTHAGGVLAGLASPAGPSQGELENRWSSISDYGSSAPSSASMPGGYLQHLSSGQQQQQQPLHHQRSGSVSSTSAILQGTSSSSAPGTSPYPRASPHLAQAWPRPLHERGMSAGDVRMQAPPFPYRQPSQMGQQQQQGQQAGGYGGYPPMSPSTQQHPGLPPFGQGPGLLHGLHTQHQQQQQQQDEERSNFDYGRFGGLPPPSAAFGRG